jgi:hypothetical protein
MSRSFSIISLKYSGLASFCTCFRYPISGRLYRYASRYTAHGTLTAGNDGNAILFGVMVEKIGIFTYSGFPAFSIQTYGHLL